MRSIRTILALGAIFAFATVSVTAQTTYHFVADEGYWGHNLNWSPWGVPDADEALLAAKRSGKNRIQLAENAAAPPQPSD